MKRIALAISILLCSSFAFAAEWITFEHKDGGFKVLLPRKPEESEQDIPGEKGTMKMKLFLLDQSNYKDENTLYGVNYFDHWHNVATGQDTYNRTLTVGAISSPMQLVAVFRHTALPSGSSIMVSGSDVLGNAADGMHITLMDDENHSTQSGK